MELHAARQWRSGRLADGQGGHVVTAHTWRKYAGPGIRQQVVYRRNPPSALNLSMAAITTGGVCPKNHCIRCSSGEDEFPRRYAQTEAGVRAAPASAGIGG